MTASPIPPPGVYTPSPTFFKSHGAGPNGRQEVDIDAQVEHTIYLAKNGIKGVVLLGSTGEMIHMTRKEREDFVSGVKQGLEAKGYGDFPILAGVAQNGIEDTLLDIKGLKQAGAQWAMVLAPNYFAPSTPQQGLISWFTAVADESPLPVLIYHFPGVSNNLKITPATFETLSKHPNIVGCKLSHGDLTQYTQIALNPNVKDFTPMAGLGQLLLPAIVVGIEATIDAMSGIFPKTLVKLFELSSQGKIAEAQKIQYVVTRVEEIVAAFGPLGIKYTVKKVLNIGENAYGRAPLSEPLTAAQTSQYDQFIEEAWALEQSL